MGLMLGPASTDAVNRAPSTSYSEVTGITQTSRNFGASLGLAVLGAILIDQNKRNIVHALAARGVSASRAARGCKLDWLRTRGLGLGLGGDRAAGARDHSRTAQSTQTVFYIMAAAMAATFLVTARWSPRGRTESVNESEELAAIARPAEAGS